ncbi:hypothetical protein GCM10025860_15810 [Methanobacterium ferruginis]|nr:hypothetical protein GCM10025860_15810 [Methanobacterium ferruginis]
MIVMSNKRSKINLTLSLMILFTIITSFSGCISEDPEGGCSDCSVCTGCDIGMNSTEEARLFDELTGIVKNYVAEKESITDQSTIQTYITFKSKNESFVTAEVNGKTWNGTWLYSDGEWSPGEDFGSH